MPSTNSTHSDGTIRRRTDYEVLKAMSEGMRLTMEALRRQQFLTEHVVRCPACRRISPPTHLCETHARMARDLGLEQSSHAPPR